MSEENVAAVRSFYEAWSRGEFPGPVELIDPEIEYVNPASAVEAGTRRGIDAFGDAVRRVFETWDPWEMNPDSLRAVDDQVVVELSYRARGSGSGIEVRGRFSALWTLREGRVTRFEWFPAPADAGKAAGSGG